MPSSASTLGCVAHLRGRIGTRAHIRQDVRCVTWTYLRDGGPHLLLSAAAPPACQLLHLPRSLLKPTPSNLTTVTRWLFPSRKRSHRTPRYLVTYR